MNLREKTGDFMLDIAKLVFGGVILTGVVAEDINRAWLYSIGCVAFALCTAAGMLLYKQTQRKED